MKKAFLFLTLAAFLSVNQLAAQSNAIDTAAKTQTTGDEKIFEKVEIEASVNMQAWRKHLESNLLHYIENAANRNMKAGVYTVNIRFLVEKNGSISDVKALNDPGFGLAQGAVRVVRTGPKWTAGEVNGMKVRSYHTQPITFMIQEQTKPNKKGD
ncbi:MAG TPA: energy transducer TonB [Flavisolibacter sp.]|nr:energy transducer TonB [Flavisolibacter sp.]